MAAILKRAEIDSWKDCFQTLRRSCATEWKLTLPAHAVNEWLGHCAGVSERFYTMVTDDLWDRATQRAAYALPQSARTPSHWLAKGVDEIDESRECHDSTHEKTPIKKGVLETSGARTRTGDLGFMNPTL